MGNLKQKLSALSPPGLLNAYVRLKRRLRSQRIKQTKVAQEAGVYNIFHCCPQKTASQWLKTIFEDPVIYKYSGLFPYNFADYAKAVDLPDAQQYHFPEPFPEKTLATPLYLTYQQFQAIPKTGAYRAFFVIRDPRDLVVSQYFSKLYSHKRSAEIDQVRQELSQYSQKDGLARTIDLLAENGYWDRIRSWGDAGEAALTIVKYEHLTSGDTAFDTFKALLAFCQLPVPDQALQEVLNRKSFEKLSDGRNPGEEDTASHYRKGVAGDWLNYFDTELKSKFEAVAGDIVTTFNYEPS
jgi:hypothetical protein